MLPQFPSSFFYPNTRQNHPQKRFKTAHPCKKAAKATQTTLKLAHNHQNSITPSSFARFQAPTRTTTTHTTHPSLNSTSHFTPNQPTQHQSSQPHITMPPNKTAAAPILTLKKRTPFHLITPIITAKIATVLKKTANHLPKSLHTHAKSPTPPLKNSHKINPRHQEIHGIS